MIEYAFYYNPTAHNSKHATKTIVQPFQEMNMVQNHNYFDVAKNPVALHVLVMTSYP
jgi:hypothetical protein